jgi:hypothetical protein
LVIRLLQQRGGRQRSISIGPLTPKNLHGWASHIHMLVLGPFDLEIAPKQVDGHATIGLAVEN